MATINRSKEQLQELQNDIAANIRLRIAIIVSYGVLFGLLHLLAVRQSPVSWAVLGAALVTTFIIWLLFIRFPISPDPERLADAYFWFLMADMVGVTIGLMLGGGFGINGVLIPLIYVVHGSLVFPSVIQRTVVFIVATGLYFAASAAEFAGIVKVDYVFPFLEDAAKDPGIFFTKLVITTVAIPILGFYTNIYANRLQIRRKELWRERDYLATILANLTAGIIVLGENQKIVYTNAIAARLLGEPKEIKIGADLSTIGLLSREQKLREEFLVLIQSVLDKKESRSATLSMGPLLVSVTPIPIPPPTITALRTILVLQDVTREKLLDALKSDFVTIAAHQLRTPLSTLKWTINELLNESFGSVAEEQAQALRNAFSTTENMIHLLGDLLESVRFEEGKFAYEFKPIVLEDLAQKVIADTTSLAKSRRVELSLALPTPPLPPIVCDPERINFVLTTFVDNAITYNHEGGKVQVILEAKPDEVIVEVQDNGIGIPQREQTMLFTKFFRASNAIRTEATGYGLGLYIARNIVEGHGGNMWMRSEEGKGSTFGFSLPLNPERLPRGPQELIAARLRIPMRPK
ncbi:MAG: hypothetical protein A2806_03325 [Candidatus Terrybacteria bacterium RIFCSPHIGHO2_01_FULL_48_17]|uniref:histidine kinase n=1 Tax=Candidatus Terrybacteria bacterium RIFCSPHIGHO2_01_FULL_48_17 TaxID=1802362 RepID=A0A1G2PH78_9BACT|nr:MAG: hypothetical protein A2806_03325 [Candidatus Terrybacteria bacterium RIFCSPHIGHO2_01_FULL_48_17]OHA53140.1 MAG: hypothetical protein A3A30_02135 [Candidatus Terrybacteria bacterium RIFCSPLOWO2_01_FULL_48_14]